jgi:hypothetical protein
VHVNTVDVPAPSGRIGREQGSRYTVPLASVTSSTTSPLSPVPARLAAMPRACERFPGAADEAGGTVSSNQKGPGNDRGIPRRTI